MYRRLVWREEMDFHNFTAMDELICPGLSELPQGLCRWNLHYNQRTPSTINKGRNLIQSEGKTSTSPLLENLESSIPCGIQDLPAYQLVLFLWSNKTNTRIQEATSGAQYGARRRRLQINIKEPRKSLIRGTCVQPIEEDLSRIGIEPRSSA
ncbi:uncharacterized protein LOC143665410 isoform X2 [Tamandua tetradactyla]|uniref:uncharacterized protein LOC143665410 isoform X2 n=1 Tax=Tamandua tetradactyla TaxID=48850 RepID=UPI0040547C9E